MLEWDMTEWTELHSEILDTPRKKILPHLAFVKLHGFYLAGGTALALQLGHRTSVDFDFYAKDSFNAMQFEKDAVTHLKGLKITQRSAGTLIGQVRVIDLSFFHYPYPLLAPLLKTDFLDLVSVPDIAAMKLIAISQRGVRRDFLDLYVIAQKYGLDSVFEWSKKKFSQFDLHVGLKSLTYFEDAETDESGRGMELKKPVPWKKIRAFFEGEALRLARKWL